ncbi:hypothetical protein MIR68_010796 [Amoeboaphelidium protococcarum]|nr:hypothetical protein MIR68_010796 [Amoeboaphelidium protococcarum]
MKHLTIDAAGFPLSATLFEPDNALKAVVLIQSATGVKRLFYRRYAQYLMEQGCAVLIYDYRGVGDSIPDNGLTAIHADIRTSWAVIDQGAVTKFLIDRYPSTPLYMVCHSVGCHITPMNPYINKVRRVLFVGANSAHWRYARSRMSLLAFPYYVAATTKLLGYFPASKINLCDDLPSGIGYDWSRWSRFKEYCTVDPEINAAYKAFRVESLSLCFSDDHLCHYKAFKSWVDLFSDQPGRKPQLRYLTPADVGLKRVDHMGFFYDTNKEALWVPYTQWLLRNEQAKL